MSHSSVKRKEAKKHSTLSISSGIEFTLQYGIKRLFSDKPGAKMRNCLLNVLKAVVFIEKNLLVLHEFLVILMHISKMNWILFLFYSKLFSPHLN